MGTTDNRSGRPKRAQDYRTRPPEESLDETIVGVEPDTAPDSDAGRYVDQHRPLRDD